MCNYKSFESSTTHPRLTLFFKKAFKMCVITFFLFRSVTLLHDTMIPRENRTFLRHVFFLSASLSKLFSMIIFFWFIRHSRFSGNILSALIFLLSHFDLTIPSFCHSHTKFPYCVSLSPYCTLIPWNHMRRSSRVPVPWYFFFPAGGIIKFLYYSCIHQPFTIFYYFFHVYQASLMTHKV